jgi:hypothetical protein
MADEAEQGNEADANEQVCYHLTAVAFGLLPALSARVAVNG